MDKIKTFSISFKARSAKSDYACSDGEIAGAVNLYFDNGSLKAYNKENVSRLPTLTDSPFIAGKLQKPPRPEVEFSLLKSVVEGWHIHSDMLPSKIMDAPSVEKGESPGEKDWSVSAMEALGDFEEAAQKRNLFTQPFFAMAAWRLSDGSRLCPSSPMLMIPNSGVPMVEGSADFSVSTMQMSIVAAACRLQWRVKMPELPEKWNGIITHLDIFISKGISLYDSKGRAKGYHRMECKNFTHCMDSSGIACEHRVHSTVIVQGWQADAIDDAIVTRNILQTDSFFLISEMPLSQLSTMTNFENVSFNRGGLPILTSMESYVPDFAHLSEVTAEGHALFSGRITAWNLTRTPPVLLPVPLVTPYVNDTSDTSTYTPRWMFHPDISTGSYPYSQGSSTAFLPLRRHPRMWGSFYWRGFDPSASSDMEIANIQEDSDDIETSNLPGGVWRSAKGGKWLFPDSLLMNLDVRQIIAVCRAFRASGLVATIAPTAYAFTSEGVFLLREMDDGTFRDAGLICGYRLRDSSSLELLPTGVRFTTDSGEVVVIEGTKVRLSENMETLSGEEDSWEIFIPEEWEFDREDHGVTSDRRVIVTRPLKLSNAEDKKRLRSLSLRGTRLPKSADIVIYGSNDLSNWKRIALVHRTTISGLWAPSYRFFRVVIMLPPQSNVCLDGIAINAM